MYRKSVHVYDVRWRSRLRNYVRYLHNVVTNLGTKQKKKSVKAFQSDIKLRRVLLLFLPRFLSKSGMFCLCKVLQAASKRWVHYRQRQTELLTSKCYIEEFIKNKCIQLIFKTIFLSITLNCNLYLLMVLHGFPPRQVKPWDAVDFVRVSFSSIERNRA